MSEKITDRLDRFRKARSSSNDDDLPWTKRQLANRITELEMNANLLKSRTATLIRLVEMMLDRLQGRSFTRKRMLGGRRRLYCQEGDRVDKKSSRIT